jgi:hypothetical protein
MNPIHTNRKSACINIIINLSLLSIMVYIVKTSSKSSSPIDNNNILQTPNKDTINILPQGDWMTNTITYNIISGNILCGIIKNNDNFNIGIPKSETIYNSDRIYSSHQLYNNDCIIFNKHNFITTSNGKFKIIF